MSISQFVYVNKPKSNEFNLSHTTANTCNAGELRVNLCELALPGDKWLLNSTSLVRSQAMITSPFQNIRVNQRFFFVPLRFLMTDFENFITGGIDGTDSTPRPYVDSGATGWSAGSLMDDLGAATNYVDDNGSTVVVPDMQASAFAPRAYNKIINDWFINENLQGAERTLNLGSGLDSTTDLSIYNVCWKPDYFTNGLPFTGRGPTTSIPISGNLSVKGNGMSLGLTDGTLTGGLHTISAGNTGTLIGNPNQYGKNVGHADGTNTYLGISKAVGVTTDADKSGLIADASTASMIDINQLRELIAINNQKQISAYVGGRFTEWLLGMWGVRSSDLRLQRSHFLGGSTTPLYIEDVEQTSSTDATSPQANLAGRGVSVNFGNGFKYFVEEPGIIMGMFWIMPDSKYFQGQRRWLSYQDRLDYPNPRLALIGDQATWQSEIVAQGVGHSTTLSDGTVIADDSIFNFNPRFEEVRGIPSSVHGEFKTNMKYYHLARELPKTTAFNTDFANGQPSKRIFAVTTQEENSYVYETGFKIKAFRRFPKNGFPATFGLI